MRNQVSLMVTLAIVLAAAPALLAQGVPNRIRRPPTPPTAAPDVAQPVSPAPAPAPISAPAPAPGAPTAALPPSLLEQPAQAAVIQFSADSLSIRADNSSLTGILHEVAKLSGMKIDGLSGDQRVFGSFGPGNPFDVLSDLLNGTAYNVLMVGSLTNGAPRQLSLLPVHEGMAPAAAPSDSVSADQAGDQDKADGSAEPDSQPPGPPGSPQGVRTPQQMFEQLQAMRLQQQQQQQQQGQQPGWQRPQPDQQ